jgi:outer membrane protein assembly factor BamB
MERECSIRVVVLTAIMFGVALAGCGSGSPHVTTQHNDNYRSGAYLAEAELTPASVLARGMQIRYEVPRCNGQNDDRCIEGVVLGQPLYVHNVEFQSAYAHGVFVATDRNWVYGLNAATGDRLWRTQAPWGASRGFVSRGVMATPVIDVRNNALYVVFSIRKPLPGVIDCNGEVGLAARRCSLERYRHENSEVEYWLAVLDLRTGAIRRQTRIEGAVVRPELRLVKFEPREQRGKVALLLDRGQLYVAFGSIAEAEGLSNYKYHGWVFRYEAANFALQRIFCTTPDSNALEVEESGGGGIWQGGGGLVAGPDGSVYFLTGNGVADFPGRVSGQSTPNVNYGDSFVRFAPPHEWSAPLAFAPASAEILAKNDADLGSGGALFVPESNVVVGGGKSGILYVLDRNTMALLEEFPATTNSYDPTQRDNHWETGPHMHGSLTWWRGPDPGQGNFYVWGEKDFLKLYRFDLARNRFVRYADPTDGKMRVKPHRQGKVRAVKKGMPGGMLSVSARGDRAGTGIVWATLPDHDPPGANPGRLYAFDAEMLTPLWDSVDTFLLSHWVPPTIANGLVFVPTGDGKLLAYGLGPQGGGGGRSWSPSLPSWGLGECKVCHEGPDVKVPESPPPPRPISAGRWPWPSAAHVKTRMAEGMGSMRYEAADAEQGRVAWKLVSRVGNAADVDARVDHHGPYIGADPAMLWLVRWDEREGVTEWKASDGSAAVASLDSSQRAPEAMRDAPWESWRVLRTEGDGMLRGAEFIAVVNTHGGVPREGAKKLGEETEVPVHAQYLVFHREAELKEKTQAAVDGGR